MPGDLINAWYSRGTGSISIHITVHNNLISITDASSTQAAAISLCWVHSTSCLLATYNCFIIVEVNQLRLRTLKVIPPIQPCVLSPGESVSRCCPQPTAVSQGQMRIPAGIPSSHPQKSGAWESAFSRMGVWVHPVIA